MGTVIPVLLFRPNPYRYIDPDGKWRLNLVAAWRCAKIGGAIGDEWGFAVGALMCFGALA